MVAPPSVGVTRLSIIRSVVVLPEPFGPRKPVTRPGSTVNDSPSTARSFFLYTLVRRETTSCPCMGLPSEQLRARSSKHSRTSPTDYTQREQPPLGAS